MKFYNFVVKNLKIYMYEFCEFVIMQFNSKSNEVSQLPVSLLFLLIYDYLFIFCLFVDNGLSIYLGLNKSILRLVLRVSFSN